MKKLVFKRLLILTVSAAILLSAVACTPADNKPGDDSLQKILDKGELVLGLDTGFPPMGFIDDTGTVVGFDIYVAQEVCRRLGVKLVTKGINWDTKEDDLNNGTIDCIWNGMSVTPARSESMNLSEPYMKNELIIVVLGSSDIKGLRDLKGKSVGVQSGSSAEEALMESDFYSDVTVIPFEDTIAMLNELDQGKMNAVIVDSVVAYYFISTSANRFFVLPDSLGEEEYAIGFRKKDQALRDKVQEILIEMKTDGSLSRISKTWFGSDITTVR